MCTGRGRFIRNRRTEGKISAIIIYTVFPFNFTPLMTISFDQRAILHELGKIPRRTEGTGYRGNIYARTISKILQTGKFHVKPFYCVIIA